MFSVGIPLPDLQIAFSYNLGQARNLYLQEALLATVEAIDLSQLDKELAEFVPQKYLKALAIHGLRGELIYPVPCLFRQNPWLIAYYRLLLGFSMKEFYTKKFGVSGFKSMEEKGILTKVNFERLPILCEGLVSSALGLVDGIGKDRISKELLDDLTLITLGPKFRGSANNTKGQLGTSSVFQVIHGIVKNAAVNSSVSRIELRNSSGRKVLIEFAPDPDIVIREEVGSGRYRNLVAIEIKGGTDVSNIHNRLGEAEKSHLKARQQGYVEFWTVVNVDELEFSMAKQESPTTNSFFKLSELVALKGRGYQKFKEVLSSSTGIKNS